MVDSNNISWTIGIALLSLLISLINFWWLNLRGPKIIGSKIRYLTIANLPQGASINTHLSFTNIGSTTGIIETIFVTLGYISINSKLSAFFPVQEDCPNNYIPPNAYEGNPMYPFAIEPKSSISKKILFCNYENFQFQLGEYDLKIYYVLAGKEKAELFSERRIKVMKVPKFTNERFEYITGAAPIAIDPLEVPPANANFEWWRVV